MDIGGDKPLRYLPLPHEDNPALGLRGIRTACGARTCCGRSCARRCASRPAGIVRLLLPMVTDVAEMRAVRAIVDEVRAELGGRAPVEIGAMIETPAAALTARRCMPAKPTSCRSAATT